MSESFTDAALIEESRRGSPVAFDALMQRYERLVFAVAWAHTQERESALDVTQEVFLKVYQKLEHVTGSAGAFQGLAPPDRLPGEPQLAAPPPAATARREELPPGSWPGPECRRSRSRISCARKRSGGSATGVDRLPPRQQLAITAALLPGPAGARVGSGRWAAPRAPGKNLLFRGLQKLQGPTGPDVPMEKEP